MQFSFIVTHCDCAYASENRCVKIGRTYSGLSIQTRLQRICMLWFNAQVQAAGSLQWLSLLICRTLPVAYVKKKMVKIWAWKVQLWETALWKRLYASCLSRRSYQWKLLDFFFFWAQKETHCYLKKKKQQCFCLFHFFSSRSRFNSCVTLMLNWTLF